MKNVTTKSSVTKKSGLEGMEIERCSLHQMGYEETTEFNWVKKVTTVDKGGEPQMEVEEPENLVQMQSFCESFSTQGA
ncbi:hypothetical protein ERO13_A08G100700v2 [Gossypium hirsutum]|uniref:Uncharacterized protein n=3 Tax=Gossypium TaxID=3633 RepID=A0A5J5UQC7_GOSBA|nr:hypothetical protein ES319_A08G107300v1 [Gossypium barbadense]KAG4187396.1 hypothetical protein ERO13_A08G100700v2 [Gossypium hirsutum]TYH05926.1 hypothetical protein ES288_A08G117900v1 [Gossypium darwinii]TYI14386.1 hypothetical protein ES332_A08G117600v1 [Gossypium tomentosum]